MTHQKLWLRSEYFVPPATKTSDDYPYRESKCRVVVKRYTRLRDERCAVGKGAVHE